MHINEVYLDTNFCFYQIDLRRAYNCEIMLTKIKIPLPDMIVSIKSLLVY